VGQQSSIQLPLHLGGRTYKNSSEATGAGDAAAVLHLRMRLLDIEQCGVQEPRSRGVQDLPVRAGGKVEAPTATGDHGKSARSKSRSCAVS